MTIMNCSSAEIRSLTLTAVSIQAIVGVNHDRRLTFHTRQEGCRSMYNVLFDEATSRKVMADLPRQTISASGSVDDSGRFVARQLEVFGQWRTILP